MSDSMPVPEDDRNIAFPSEPWAPHQFPVERRPAGWGLFLPIIEGSALGLGLAIVDINSAGHPELTLLFYFTGGLLLGIRHRRWSFLAWPQSGFLLYWVHLWAIGHGYRQPYVEASAAKAIGCFEVLIPAGLGLLVGAIGRYLSTVADECETGVRR